MSVFAALFGTACACLAAALASMLLHHFPQPAGADPPDEPGDLEAHVSTGPVTVFTGLRRVSFIGPVAGLAGVGGLTAAVLLPGDQLPLWLVLSTVGVLAGGIDSATTWIPRHLTYLGWVSSAAAAAVTAIASAVQHPGPAGWTAAFSLGWPAVGVVVFTLALGLVWRLGGSGFGDVRLAPVIGAASGTLGEFGIFAGLLTGILAVAGHKLVLGLLNRRRRDGVHPFGPGLVLGGYLALVLSITWTGR